MQTPWRWLRARLVEVKRAHRWWRREQITEAGEDAERERNRERDHAGEPDARRAAAD